jgi:transposase InsO family protein
MREAGLCARTARLYRRIPGLHRFFTSLPNRQLDRLATAPDQVWVGDITYLKVGGTWRYLAVVMDRYSRRVLGWRLSATKDAHLTLAAALNRAVFHRRPRPGVIFHSDRGVEYAAYAFRDRLATLGFVQIMNRPREITDNAHMESFFHSMKSDAVHGVAFMHEGELARRLRSYIPYYNRAYGCIRRSAMLHQINYEARAQSSQSVSTKEVKIPAGSRALAAAALCRN